MSYFGNYFGGYFGNYYGGSSAAATSPSGLSYGGGGYAEPPPIVTPPWRTHDGRERRRDFSRLAVGLKAYSGYQAPPGRRTKTGRIEFVFHEKPKLAEFAFYPKPEPAVQTVVSEFHFYPRLGALVPVAARGAGLDLRAIGWAVVWVGVGAATGAALHWWWKEG